MNPKPTADSNAKTAHPSGEASLPNAKHSQQRIARPLRETVKRMDCPSVMREHFWSIEREGMIECLWCFERRRVSGPTSPGQGSPLERMVRELAETWERRAIEWDALKQRCPEITSMAAIYREMAEDLRAVCGKLPNVAHERDDEAKPN